MATRSALINVMHKAATAASRGMLRDFGEVEIYKSAAKAQQILSRERIPMPNV